MAALHQALITERVVGRDDDFFQWLEHQVVNAGWLSSERRQQDGGTALVFSVNPIKILAFRKGNIFLIPEKGNLPWRCLITSSCRETRRNKQP